MSLLDLRIGETAIILGVEGEDKLCKRLRELGFIKGTKVQIAFFSPSKDPIAYRIFNSVIAIRSESASMIKIKRTDDIRNAGQ